MTTSRTSAASPPVTGSVGVSFEGKSVGKDLSTHPHNDLKITLSLIDLQICSGFFSENYDFNFIFFGQIFLPRLRRGK